MADVQIENGYTKIANEILDNMARIKLSPTQYRLVFVIWRFTYGYGRKEHDLSLAFLSEATGGCDKRQIQRELKALEERNIIYQKIKTGAFRIIGFNKNHENWDGKSVGNIGEIVNTTIGETVNGEDVQSIGETVNLSTRDGETTIGETVNTRVGEIVNTTIGETVNGEDVQSIGETVNLSTRDGETTIGETVNTRVGEIVNTTIGETVNQEIKNKEKYKEINDDEEQGQGSHLTSQQIFQAVADKYIQRRQRGMETSAQDDLSIREVIAHGIPLPDIVRLIDERFDTYKPKYPRDRINSFSYVADYIFQRHYEEQQKRAVLAAKVVPIRKEERNEKPERDPQKPKYDYGF